MEMESEEAEASASMQQEQVQMPPVLEEKKKKKMLVAIDESDESIYALKWALDNLFFDVNTGHVADQQQKGEETGVVILVHVQQPLQHYIFPAGPAVYATTPVIDSVKKAQAQNTALLVSRAMQLFNGRAIKVETIVCDGDPKDMICQTADHTHPDIVVVGSRGFSKLKRAFLGSVSDYCAHHVKCPILIVKPPK
ncbi:Adenine nucleotide alpha hydrolases-like superfamily protein [Thalictrum thalictroides]|uniref:Adenine nucleotide alpha hydrolases-like superfamily protein n=1 Tax=Thalictrum thalictroides TaxID=46969 RepID=A0A7J6UXZ1_THATH|nr:Adenine nucleotide alpha hydrolases-like superfamily protein [Thalictrum thalictroides]